jgi:hypothetical protein
MTVQTKQAIREIKPFLPPSVENMAPILLPDKVQTLFLRACLHQGGAGQKAYKEWREQVDDPVLYFGDDKAGTKRLLPLFYDTVKRNRLSVEQRFLTYLRAASFTEEIRFDAYSSACGQVLDILNRAGIEYLVLKGAAYAAAFYRAPSLRHSDDLDLLLREKDLFIAVDALLRAGLKPYSFPMDVGTHHLTKIFHPSGLSVELHRRLYDPYCYYFPFDELWRMGRMIMIAGRKSRMTGPVDSLLNILTHATMCASQRSLRWACDAWLLVTGYPALDWKLFVEKAFRSKTEMPVSYTLTYMVRELQLPVPEWVPTALSEKTRRASFKQRCAFVYGVRNNYPKQFCAILRMPASKAFRLRQLLWLYFPFLMILPLTGGMRIPALAPFYYLLRVLKTLTRRLMRRIMNRPSNRPGEDMV